MKGGVLPVAGGSIISHRHILCAAITLQPENRIINVHIGGNTRQTQRPMTVNHTIQHPDFVHTTRENDIGIIFLIQTITFNLISRPISLPTVESTEIPFENVQGQVLGFGGIANNQQHGSSKKDFTS